MRSLKRAAQTAVRIAKSVATRGSLQGDHLGLALESLSAPVPEVFQKSLFNFTIDFELGYGNALAPDGAELSEDYRLRAVSAQAQNFGPFVELLVEQKFPITWAILGRLVDPAPPTRRFQPPWAKKDWYELPSAIAKRNEFQDGPAYLKVIREKLPRHEIASHGLAHIEYNDPTTTQDVAREDLVSSRELLEKYFGRPVNAFVFPCNRVGNLALLKSSGYAIARGNTPEWQLGETILTPIGFWISPGVMSWRDFRLLLKTAIKRRAYLHPWMHLEECDLRQNDLRDFYRPVFEMVQEAHESGRIEVVSMGEIAEQVRRPRRG